MPPLLLRAEWPSRNDDFQWVDQWHGRMEQYYPADHFTDRQVGTGNYWHVGNACQHHKSQFAPGKDLVSRTCYEKLGASSTCGGMMHGNHTGCYHWSYKYAR